MLCYSTGSLPDALSFSEIINLLSPTPFRGVELVVTPEMLKLAGDGTYWRGVRSDFEAVGLVFRNVHMGAPYLMGPEPHRPGFSTLDAFGRARKVEAAQLSMAIATHLGSPHLTLTTGLPESELTGGMQIEALNSVLTNLIRKKNPQLIFLIEQEPEHVIRSTEQLLALGRAFSGDVFVNFDVGHSEVMGEDIAACILRLGPLLRNIHLEDIKDKVHAHKLYGDGDVDFAGIFKSLRAIDYRWDYTPDLYPFKNDPVNAMAASLDFLSQYEVY